MQRKYELSISADYVPEMGRNRGSQGIFPECH